MTQTNDAPHHEPNIADAAAPVADLPTSGRLLRSTLIAAGVATLLLVVVVLPAEYGRDATGIGRVLGLTQMGEVKQALARENAATDSTAAAAARATVASAPAAGTGTTPAAVPATAPAPVEAAPAPAPAPAAAATVPAAAATAPVAAATTAWTDSATVTLAPGQGREIKLAMRKDARATYRWATTGGPVNYDTHADRAAAPAIKYYGYAKGQGKRSDEGVLVAAFDGMHGWYWRNRGSAPVTVTLWTRGAYTEFKRMD